MYRKNFLLTGPFSERCASGSTGFSVSFQVVLCPSILQKTEKRHHRSKGSPTSAVTACRMVLYIRVPVPVTGCMGKNLRQTA